MISPVAHRLLLHSHEVVPEWNCNDGHGEENSREEAGVIKGIVTKQSEITRIWWVFVYKLSNSFFFRSIRDCSFI